jgi:hypothetical protein
MWFYYDFVESSAKKVTIYCKLQISIVFMNILLEDIAMCLIYIMGFLLLIVYSHRQMKTQ